MTTVGAVGGAVRIVRREPPPEEAVYGMFAAGGAGRNGADRCGGSVGDALGRGAPMRKVLRGVSSAVACGAALRAA